MKTLKKNNEIRRVKDSTHPDRLKIDEMVQSGWKLVPKSEWKNSRIKSENPVKEDKKVKKKNGKTGI